MGVRSRSLVASLAAACAGAVVIVACQSFSGTEPELIADAAADGADLVDAAVDAPPDADAGADMDASPAPKLGVTCPPPSGPKCALGGCPRRAIIAAPAVPEYPFDIATDASSLYWTAQAAGDSGLDAYNGQAPARVLRHAKKAGGPAFEIAAAQPAARAIALDGSYVYWTIHDPTRPGRGLGSPGVLRRARRDCSTTPCAVEDLASIAGNVASLSRAREGALVGVTEDGHVFVVDTTASPIGFNASATQVDTYPAIAVTNDAAYASSALVSRYVKRLDLTTGTVLPMFAAVPDGGAGADPGISPSTTDCDAVWGVRKQTSKRDLFRFAVDGGPAQVTALPTAISPFAMAADASYVYFAVPDAGGVFAVDTHVGGALPEPIATGNVWRLAVDSDGVYWGEHGTTAPGSITMLVK